MIIIGYQSTEGVTGDASLTIAREYITTANVATTASSFIYIFLRLNLRVLVLFRVESRGTVPVGTLVESKITHHSQATKTKEDGFR
ncbi:hypothetical protein GOODEAATRI_019239 [Goodea atripinnis]|uniref:Uncharacterized protein n=1 Tax=Goodea atripinnis TaxID=208336 RepID=A0ABV0NC73_9TELE